MIKGLFSGCLKVRPIDATKKELKVEITSSISILSIVSDATKKELKAWKSIRGEDGQQPMQLRKN